MDNNNTCLLFFTHFYHISGPPTTPPPTTAAPPSGHCDGVPSTDWSCCTSASPCSVAGGDCDTDSHCAGSLTCGTNNCLADFSSSGSSWDSAADCCIGK